MKIYYTNKYWNKLEYKILAEVATTSYWRNYEKNETEFLILWLNWISESLINIPIVIMKNQNIKEHYYQCYWDFIYTQDISILDWYIKYKKEERKTQLKIELENI
jgi:hypothetical protein